MSSNTRAVLGLVLILLVACLTSCGGGDSEPTLATSRQLRESLSEYETYLQKNVEKLRHWAGTIMLKLREGSVPKAQSRFAAAQVPRGHIDPAARGQAGDIDAGFLELEKALFEEESSMGMVATAKQLRSDIEALQRHLNHADPQPDRLVKGASGILADVVDSDLIGKGVPYSDGELMVVAAKVEGAGAAIAAVKPLVREEDPDLLKKVEAALAKSYAELGEYGILARDPEQQRPQEPGIAFIVFSNVAKADIERLTGTIEALEKQVLQVEDELGV